MLGDFETGLDGWQTNGGNRLARVDDEEAAGVVAEGEHALEVTVSGDPHPMIENERRVGRADFAGHPYLLADVVPGAVSDTESEVTFTFRYHHDAASGGSPRGGDGRGDRQNKSVLVAESEPITVSPLVRTRLFWDMSGLDEETLASPRRLEVAWHPADHPPDAGPRGRGRGFDYRGNVWFDNVRLSDDVSDVSVAAIESQMQSLKLDHGIITRTEVDTRTADLEEGSFVFADGTRVPYRFEVVADGRFRYTIDGETHELRGESL